MNKKYLGVVCLFCGKNVPDDDEGNAFIDYYAITPVGLIECITHEGCRDHPNNSFWCASCEDDLCEAYGSIYHCSNCEDVLCLNCANYHCKRVCTDVKMDDFDENKPIIKKKNENKFKINLD